MKKKYFGMVGSVLLSGILLAGCGEQKPTDAVDGFLTSFKKGDVEKAGSYIEGGIDGLTEDSEDTEWTEDMMKAIIKDYSFEDPEEVSVKGDTAKVKAKITSVDVGVALTDAMSEVLPLALANAFDEDAKDSDKAMEALMEKKVLKNLKAEDAEMSTRTVEFNLKKDKDGDYKIVADNHLRDSVFAGADALEESFGEDAEDDAPEQTSKVLSTIAKDKNYDVKPIKLTVNEVSFKKATNVSEDEQSTISFASEKEVGSEFNYLYINYTAENTSDKDFDFGGITEAVVFSEGKQERLGADTDTDFIDSDEDADGKYYGKVTKEGEVGFVLDTDPSKVDKIRLVIGSTMEDNDEYENTTDEKVVEFEMKK